MLIGKARQRCSWRPPAWSRAPGPSRWCPAPSGTAGCLTRGSSRREVRRSSQVSWGWLCFPRSLLLAYLPGSLGLEPPWGRAVPHGLGPPPSPCPCGQAGAAGGKDRWRGEEPIARNTCGVCFVMFPVSVIPLKIQGLSVEKAVHSSYLDFLNFSRSGSCVFA